MFERRRAYRVNVSEACARCSSPASVGHYSIKDVSTGGVLLEGGPILPVGTPMEVLLILPGQRPFVLRGEVLRHDEAEWQHESELAVGFSEVTADVEDAIEDTVLLELARHRPPEVLVATSPQAESEALARSLCLVGCPAAQVCTPLEAIACLEQPEGAISTVFFGDSVGGVRGLDFATFLAGSHPTLRRVFVTHDSEQQPNGLAHAVLPAPWTESLVVRALEG